MTLSEIKKEWRDELFRYPNVRSVGIGVKYVGGSSTSEPCVVVGVVEKKPLAELRLDDVVPRELDGVKTDVVVVGNIRKRILEPGVISAEAITSRYRPCQGGPSCGHFRITAGTVGVWVGRQDDVGSREWYLLSNNHVLADENEASLGDSIYQPGPYDGGSPVDAIAHLTAYTPINFSGENRIDAAVAKAADPSFAEEGVLNLPKVGGLCREAVVGMPVLKVGRTTSRTDGVIEQMEASVLVGYSNGQALFEDQLIITPGGFSAPGDSGSSVWASDMRFVGLLFAGSDTVTIVCQHGHIFSELNLLIRI